MACLRGHVLGRALDAVLALALDPGQAVVDDLDVAGAAEHDVVRLQVGVIDLPAVHVDQARGDAFEDLHQVRQSDAAAAVERLAVDILDEQVNLADAEQPVLLLFQGVDLDEVGVIEHLGRRGTRVRPAARNFCSSAPAIGTTLRA